MLLGGGGGLGHGRIEQWREKKRAKELTGRNNSVVIVGGKGLGGGGMDMGR